MLQVFSRKSGVSLLLATAAFCASAEAAVLEFESIRRTVTPFGAGPETFTQQGFDGVPSVNVTTVFNDGRYRATGETFGGLQDSVNGRYTVDFFTNRSDGIGLFAGFSYITDTADGWQGGTGNYAGATALTAFAGFSSSTATANVNNTADFGYINAPAITSPAYLRADVSPAGQPGPDTSVFDNAALGYHDVSFSIRSNPYTFSPSAVETALPGVGPAGAFDRQTHRFTEDTAVFEWTGSDGAFLRGDMTFVPPPVGLGTIPAADPASTERRTLMAGYYRVLEGQVSGLQVTAGYIAFSGLDVGALENGDEGTGLVSLEAYGWIQTQPVPEPETWAMLALGGLLLAGHRARQSRASRRA